MSEPTTGPYLAKIRSDMGTIQIISENVETVRPIAVAFTTNGKPDDPVMIANAQLLATSWELAKACERALEYLENVVQHTIEASRIREELRAAIAKARGETP